MKKTKVFEIIKNLPFDEKKVLFTEGTFSVYVLRPSKLSKRFKDYDINRNFQIFISDGLRDFRPNHLRVFIDLNLRFRSRPDLKKNLLAAFDNIFYGEDPEKEVEYLSKEEFVHFLNPLGVTAILSQLFIIEQEYCYKKESNFNPPTLFYQGWVREFLDSPKEIDNLCMRVCNRQSPSAKYVAKENKKSTKYSGNLRPLWYL